MFVCFLYGCGEKSSDDYDLSCVRQEKDGNKVLKLTSNMIFNHKESNGKTNYQLKVYNKMEVEYEDGLTDEDWEKLIQAFDSSACGPFSDIDCSANTIDLGLTGEGFETIAIRNGNKATVTYYSLAGLGLTATDEDIQLTKDTYEQAGMTCK